MVVDDMIFNLQAVEILLSEYDKYFQIHSFYQANDVLEFYNKEKNIDIILMDIDMPEKDGIKLVSEMLQID